MKMTKRQAIHILIDHAASDCLGAGCVSGHKIPSNEETLRVSAAVLKVWPERGHEPNWYNLHLPVPETKEGRRNE